MFLEAQSEAILDTPKILTKAIDRSQHCQRNFDLSKSIPEVDMKKMVHAVTQCPSKQNVALYEAHFITNRDVIEEKTENIYEAISIIAKRAEQIKGDVKKELIDKLEEFATYNDSLEEIFENKEQIEVSKFYERLPKAHAIAIQEWLEEKIYHRDSNEEIEE